jgi:hypothetical protein
VSFEDLAILALTRDSDHGFLSRTAVSSRGAVHKFVLSASAEKPEQMEREYGCASRRPRLPASTVHHDHCADHERHLGTLADRPAAPTSCWGTSAHCKYYSTVGSWAIRKGSLECEHSLARPSLGRATGKRPHSVRGRWAQNEWRTCACLPVERHGFCE